MSNVTILADEKLTGWKREYREVVRGAKKGELIIVKSTKPNYRFYSVGDIGRVISSDLVDFRGLSDSYFGEGKWQVGDTARNSSTYNVLEPTDIVQDAGGNRYRLVDRAAKIGERIVFEEDRHDQAISSAKTYVVYDIHGIWECFRDDNEVLRYRGSSSIPKSYVLEPLPNVVHTAEDTPQPNRLAALESRVLALEERVAALESPASGEPAVPNLTREDIVKQAMEDVKGRTNSHGCVEHMDACHYTLEFVVNREKRTVVALLRLAYEVPQVIRFRGIAKAAPGDCFNEYIGKAIALRRALGLSVPDEYLNAPGPEGFRAGDVVEPREDVYHTKDLITTLVERLPIYDSQVVSGVSCGNGWSHTYNRSWIGENQVRVIDDSARYEEVIE